MLNTGTYRFFIIFAFCWLCIPAVTNAHQNDNQPFQLLFGGYHRMYFETSNQQRFGSDIPLSFFRWELEPTVGVYGVPLSMNLLYTTEDNEPGGNTGRFQFGLSLSSEQLENIIRSRIQSKMDESIQQMMELDPATAMDSDWSELEASMNRLADLQASLDAGPGKLNELQDLGLLTSAERLALRFPVLGIGSSYPQYSRYVMQGITLNGFHAEYMPGNAYLGANFGNVRNPRGSPGFSQFGVFNNDRRVIAGRLGFGRPFGKHLHLMGVFVDESSLEESLNGTVFPENPLMKNVVTGVKFRVDAIQSRLHINGELAGSLITRDTDAPVLDDQDYSNLPIISSLINPNSSSSADAAGMIEADMRFPDSGTRLRAGLHYTGPGYTNLVTPALQNDILEYTGGVEQSLFRRQMTMSVNFRTDRNNLDELKNYTRTSTRFDLQLAINFRNLPWLRLQLIPITQKNTASGIFAADSGEYRFNTTVMNAVSGYTLPLGQILSTTIVNITRQVTDSDIPGANTSSFTFGLNQNAGIGNANVGAGYQRFSFTRLNNTFIRHDVTLNGSIRVLNSWLHEAGLKNSSGVDQVNVTGFYYRTSIPIRYIGTLEAMIDNSRFSNELNMGTDGLTRFNIMLTKSW
jgi:hypothetical protein